MCSCASTVKVEKIDHSDAEFKYMGSIETHRQIFERQISETDENSGQEVLIRVRVKSDPKDFFRKVEPAPIGVGMEKYVYISDAFTNDTIIEIAEVGPRFKGKDESQFIDWLLKKNKFKINSSFTLDRDVRGHII